MGLTPRELDEFLSTLAADVACRRRERGLKLNDRGAMALIASGLLNGIRDVRSVAELMVHGTTILQADDVLPGVAED